MTLLRIFAAFTTTAFVAGTATQCRNGDRTAAPSASTAGRVTWTPSRVAELFFTTEVSGYIEPCGCTTKPLGGLPRLATVIRRGRSARALVDAGNLLFPSTGFDEVTREQHRLKADLLARAYRRLNVAALNVAVADLSEGPQLLKDLQQEGATPFVSVNVHAVGDRAPEVARSFLRTIGDIKVGITGATPPEAVAGIDGVTALEYAPALAAEVKVLREERGADVVVVLAHMSEPAARDLARTVPDIDIIVRAPGTGIESAPGPARRVGRTVIVEAGQQGQHVGRITLALGPKAPDDPLLLDDADRRHARSKALLERRIRAYQTEIRAWQRDPAKAKAVEAKRKVIRRLEARLAQPAPPRTPPDAPHLRVDHIALTSDLPEDPDMRAALKSYYDRLRAMNASKGDPKKCEPEPGRPAYVGTAVCATCHPQAFEFWKETKHALAWETLEAGGKQFDLTCVGCHVVGYQQRGGFCRVQDVAGFEDVGCESCHGAGSQHSTDGDPSTIVLKATEATCAGKCHVPEHSDAFKYEPYVRQVTGPGHQLQDTER